ncbi:MAG TPA: substrate-binding domain-containing protein [Candidatus Dormibacteraeota bacterium]|nr:substrate-binding domain-containing protein [Candidatus Dormibacteraeota bacterium]
MSACAGAAALVIAACGSSSTSGGTTATVPSDLSISSFTADFSYMANLKSLTAAGTGKVGVILPDTTTSTRYVNFDLPYLKKAFDMAGYSSSDYSIQNAQGTSTTELAIAQADISNGAKVLLVDQTDIPTGQAVQAYAQSHGVKMIAYDRAVFTGTSTYYVSFDNVQVGKLIGEGFLKCASSWGVKNAQVYELDGGRDIDANAVSFAQGYNQAIWGDNTIPLADGKTNSQGMTLVHEDFAAGWDNAKGGATFAAALSAHKTINATVEANDGLGNAVVNVLKNAGIKPNTVPTTGQDATPQGLENVLLGWQCGTVYKPIYLEAQDAVALATVLRAGQTPPSALLNGQTTPPQGQTGSAQPASLLVPIWVDTSNMESTVIKDKFVDAGTICAAVTAAVCAKYNIA